MTLPRSFEWVTESTAVLLQVRVTCSLGECSWTLVLSTVLLRAKFIWGVNRNDFRLSPRQSSWHSKNLCELNALNLC